MKAFIGAALALLLTACSSLSPYTYSVVVTPVEPTIVYGEAETVAVLDAPAVVTEALEPAESELDKFVATLPVVEVPEPIALDERQLKCMSYAIYHEARGEDARGQAAVGYVILNRITDGRFRDNVCDVVYQRTKKTCQFSWVCDRTKLGHPSNQVSYERARSIAAAVMRSEVPNPIGKAIFFDGFVGRGKARVPGYVQLGGHRFYGTYAWAGKPTSTARR